MLEKIFLPKNLTNVIIKVLYIENQDITILEKRTEVYMKEKRRGMGMRLCMIQILLSCTISGVQRCTPEEDTVSETVIGIQAIPEEPQENAEEIINICIDLYKKAAEENKIDDLETIRSIVNCLGENGYPAVDSRNQINMTEPEKVVEFCEKVDAQEEAEITILEVSYLGGFVKYDLHSKDGSVDVVRSYYKYEKWRYTKRGYWKLSSGVLELYRRRLPDVFRCLVFRRIVCSYVE